MEIKHGWLPLLLVLVAVPSQSQESIVLTDSIRSNGVGRIDLLKDLEPDALEVLRQDTGGELVFGVDINEASSGTEKATTQGVAIATARLVLEFTDGSAITYTAPDYRTRTMALVAPAGQSDRGPYFTLLGESGSSRLSSVNAIQDIFDSTLTFDVDAPVDQRGGVALALATLEVDLLETNEALGDPEAFYDFSAGFEDLAVLNAADRAFIDGYAAGLNEAPAVIPTDTELASEPLAVEVWTYYPDAAGYYLVAYEDLYPQVGDYDWNDLVVAYQVRLGTNATNELVAIRASAYLVARGALFSHDWRLRIALPADIDGTISCQVEPVGESVYPCQDDATQLKGSLDVALFSDTAALFSESSGLPFTNTLPGSDFTVGPRSELVVNLSAPVALNAVAQAPFDPLLFVRDTGRSVQLLSVNPLARDEYGYPFAMLMSSTWNPPFEGVDMRAAYPEFDLFTSTKGVDGQQWYVDPTAGRVRNLPERSVWAW